MVGAARFELATPGPPDIASCLSLRCSLRRLAGSSVGASGLISGLLVALNVFQRGSNLIIQNMSIPGRGLDVRVVQRLLDELEIADRIIERLTYLHILRRTRERAILISYRGMRVSGR